MLHLLNIEYAKVKNYKVFWIIILIYAALVPIGFVGLSQFILNLILIGFGPTFKDVSSFPDVWHYIAWTTSWWNIMLGVLVVIITVNEISYKTQRQNIIDGMSRRDVILSKFYFVVALALVVTIYTTLVAFIFGLINTPGFSGFGPGMQYMGIYFIQTLGYFGFAYFLAVLVRKSALSIILYFVIFVANLFWGAAVGDVVVQFIPTYLISGLVPFPFFQEFTEMARQQQPGFEQPWLMADGLKYVLGVVYTLVFVAIGYISVRKRDL